ncbi:MAG: outer rane efflux protein [Phycisphaerales bacterium]|nr:outer rane efflux protein [Phycisphaerales bacterium]MDB5356915.1 outer rane efflux protein [Phycisphaerales bacterium]
MNRSDRIRSNSFLVAALALAGLLAGGCVVDQKKEVATYRKVLDGKNPPRVTYTAPEPLTLEATLLLANRNDEILASSGEDYLQSLINKERAFSTFLPTISFAPTYNWVDKRGRSFTGAPVKQGVTDAPITSRYNVFNGFQDYYNYQAVGYTIEQRKAQLLDLQQTTLLNVAQTYYTVLTAERSVQVLLNSTQVQNERVRDMEGRQRAGVARPLDVAQTEANAAATRVQLIQAQNNVRDARIMLAFLTDAPVQDAPLADRLVVPDNLPSADDSLKLAESTRQDIQAAEASIESFRQLVNAAIGQYYPSVTLNVDYFLHKESFPTFSEWSGIVQLSTPIFTAGQIEANVRTAWSQLRQAWLNANHTRRLVSEQVRTAYENLQASNRRIVELRVEVAAAQEAYRQAQQTYTAGLATNLDVLTAQDALLSSQLSLANEEFNYKLFYLQLLRSMGRLARPDSPLPPPGAPASQPSPAEVETPRLNTPR